MTLGELNAAAKVRYGVCVSTQFQEIQSYLKNNKNNKNNMQNKPSAAQRKAQSNRDKAINAVKSGSAMPMRGSPLSKFIPRPPRPFVPIAARMGLRAPARPKQPNNFPRVANRGPGGALSEDITFDEFVADINGSVAFTATKFPHQPGLSGTFPKGSIKAALYSEWKQLKCEYYYKPEVSGFATQGQGGKVILAMDYNAGNPAPTTKQQVEIMHRVDDMPYEKMSLVTDSASVNRSDAKYIRTGPIPVDEDIKTFDGGNLWVCTIGQANGNIVGELHARYTFRCTKPTLLNPAQGALIPNVTVGMFRSTGAETPAASTVPFNLLAAKVDSNGLGVVNTAGSFVPPAGNYLLDTVVSLRSASDVNNDTQLDVLKNGVSVYSAGTKPIGEETANVAGSAANGGTLSASLFVTANGTDAFIVQLTQTYANIGIVSGTVRFVAV